LVTAKPQQSPSGAQPQQGRGRRRFEPGSFVVLVYGP